LGRGEINQRNFVRFPFLRFKLESLYVIFRLRVTVVNVTVYILMNFSWNLHDTVSLCFVQESGRVYIKLIIQVFHGQLYSLDYRLQTVKESCLRLKVWNQDVRKESRARPPFCILYSLYTATCKTVLLPGRVIEYTLAGQTHILGKYWVNANCLEIIKALAYSNIIFPLAILHFTECQTKTICKNKIE